MRGRSHGDGVDSAAVQHLICLYRMVRAPWLGTGGLMPAANLLNEERVPVQLPLHLPRREDGQAKRVSEERDDAVRRRNSVTHIVEGGSQVSFPRVVVREVGL